MTKSGLIEALSKKENISEVKATEIINLVFDGFTETLKNDGRIEIRGFGAFTIRKYKGYRGRNPKTAMCVEVQPKKLPFFKVGRELKGMVDGA